MPGPSTRSWRRRPLLALLALIVLLAVGYLARALDDGNGSSPAPTPTTSRSATSGAGAHGSGSGASTDSATEVVALSQLPGQARQTVALIQREGPFPYREDGTVFDNLEQLLPIERRGFYHEYTVATPGSPDRGARRIITGADGRYYYTGDHYQSFRRIDLAH